MSDAELLKQFGFKQEVAEEVRDQYLPTPYPVPIKRFRIIWETSNMSIEEAYFWLLDYVRQDLGFSNVYKTEDVFAASENSAFFGVSQLRLGGQQDKVSQFLATIGKMVKEMFQLVRELRIIDERLVYYRESLSGVESSEITLKGIFIDMVQGGAKNPASVFGMAREVQFVSLPDLFFSTHPRVSDDVDKIVDTQRSGFNKSVRNSLKRHLKTYLVWKDKTFDEMKTRRIFTIKYLKQHFEIIKMYMTWVRPYLRHVRRLTFDEEKLLTPDLITAFEGSILEIEFLATKLPTDPDSRKQNKVMHSCIIAHFLYRTRPTMSFQQEGYQRGPVHVGRLNINLRAYVWSKKDIDNYLEMKQQQDFELMKSISASVKAAMESLGDELQGYLAEASGDVSSDRKLAEKKKNIGFFDRIRLEFRGAQYMKGGPKKSLPYGVLKGESKAAEVTVVNQMFWAFKNFKKAHGMVMW